MNEDGEKDEPGLKIKYASKKNAEQTAIGKIGHVPKIFIPRMPRSAIRYRQWKMNAMQAIADVAPSANIHPDDMYRFIRQVEKIKEEAQAKEAFASVPPKYSIVDMRIRTRLVNYVITKNPAINGKVLHLNETVSYTHLTLPTNREV